MKNNIVKKERKARKAGTDIFMDYVKLHEVKNLFKKHWLEGVISELERNYDATVNVDVAMRTAEIIQFFRDKLTHVNNHLK